MTGERDKRALGALWGLFIGDALAMPVHWYYNREALLRDYGPIRTYLAPRNPHPDSILWRSQFASPGEGFDILHDQRPFWGQRGVHYHQFLRAGENTLNLQCARLLMESLRHCGQYDADDYLKRYIAFMTTPGCHRDTYVEEVHRHFFTRLASGLSPRQCGIKEKHIGGLVGIVPIIAHYRGDLPEGSVRAHEHLALTHRGPRMTTAAACVLDILQQVIAGASLRRVLEDGMRSQRSPYFGHPFQKWQGASDHDVVGRHLSTACYVEDALPAVIYLAWKYGHDPEQGVIANCHLGGDNAHRGALLGAFFGADGGVAAFPESWVAGLLEPVPDLL
ncbi:MAG: ADP-ribosylglycohydrolase family protein [Desulfobacteraceae bacterium]|nr:ADP-ribosylglycohydrolase family protein [Desulfobacteraceae bacterium]MBC2752486.1 ADP-ribosylglycohydrolase family protein [Desulfobacteraceae bacterium]